MSPDRWELLGHARAERDGLGRMIQYAPPESWEAMSGAVGWWNRDVLAHLAAQDRAAAELLGDGTATEFAEFDEWRARSDGPGGEFTVDGFNDFAVARRAELPAREVIREWGGAADLFLERAADLSEEEWSSRRIPWLAGEIALRYLLQSRVVEWWVHGEDMRAGADLESGLRHWPIYLANDMGIRMLPYALGRAGLSFDGLSVRVDLDGAGGGSWHWGLSGRKAPPRDKRPDVFIQGRAYQFAQVATRRAAADDVLDEGNLAIGGDEEAGLAVLRHIRAFA